MAIIKYDGEYFSVKDTLYCGQVFRFTEFAKDKFKIYTTDKCAVCYNDGAYAYIECNDGDEDYFKNYFDLDRDYAKIVDYAKSKGVKVLSDAVAVGKGIRILNQDKTEMLFSFIVSQNNNIPRIKKIINTLCERLGKKITFNGEDYFTFPTVQALASVGEDFYKSIGLGYRAGYIKATADLINNGYSLDLLTALSTKDLKEELKKIHGVGPKVADCVTLFGFHRADSFPVDTWIEKLYFEDFLGTLKNRAHITDFFLKEFGEYSGYVQQYLFHYKRNG